MAAGRVGVVKGGEGPIVVVALGGNALIRRGERGTIEEQQRHLREAVTHLPLLLERGYRLVVTHGNGPTVGQLLLQNEAARDLVPPMPLEVCDADSEGGIGYLAQQALANALHARLGGRTVVSVVTQVVVDPGDPAFARPSKPIGPFYTAGQAEALRREKHWTLVEDAGRGYRRVVASPAPLEVIEEKAIRILVDQGIVVIAAGGGGIPVTRDAEGLLRGIEAVIDKDRASALLARRLGARLLVILTAEEYVYGNFGEKDQAPLAELSVAEARRRLRTGEFPPGSMGPKIEAAVDFLEGGGAEVLVTLPETLAAALEGRSGTWIRP